MDSKPQFLTFDEDDIDKKTCESLSPYKKMKFEDHDDVNFKKENDPAYNSCCFSAASFAIVKDELDVSDQEFNFDIGDYTNSSHLFKDEIIISDDESVNDKSSIGGKNGGITKEIICEVSDENTRIDNSRKWKEIEADSNVTWVENSDSDAGNSSKSMYPKAKEKWIGWNHKNGLQLLNYFKCTNCSSVFNSWQNFDAHIRMNKNALLVCSYCNFHASTTCGIYFHLRYLHNLNVFRIDVDYSLQSLAEREQSNNFNRTFSGGSNNSARFLEGLLTSGDENEGLNFLKSGKPENQNYDLGRYSRFFESILYLGNEDNLESNEFRCCFCLCILPNLVSLKVHMNRDHLTPESFECENCHFSRIFPSVFIGVVKSHHSCKESESEHFLDEVTRPRTEKQINNNSQIEHILANTDANSPKSTSNILKQKKSKCGLCEFLPRGTKSIISHMLAKHTILKLFKCLKCDHIMYYPLIVFDKVELLHECRNLKLKDLTIYQNNKSIHLEKNRKSSPSITHSSNSGTKRPFDSSHMGGADEQTNGLEKDNENGNIESEICFKADIARKNEEMESAYDILWDDHEDSGMDDMSIKTMKSSPSTSFRTATPECTALGEEVQPQTKSKKLEDFLAGRIRMSYDDLPEDILQIVSSDEEEDSSDDEFLPTFEEESDEEEIPEVTARPEDVCLAGEAASESEEFTKLETCDTSKENLHQFIYFPDEFQCPNEKILSWDDSTFDFSEDELKDPEKDPLAIEECGEGEKDTALSNSFEGLNFSRTEENVEKTNNVPSEKIMPLDQTADADGELQWRKKRVFDFSFDVLGITSRGFKLITEFHECQSCEMTFYNKMEYYKHVTNHCESGNTGINKSKHNVDRMNHSLRCERCDFTASSMASMRWHKVKYHSTGIHYFSCCPFCSYVASSNRKMSEHIHLDHSCGRVTKCFFCEHAYTQILCTHNHRASHDLTDDQAYICELCKHYSFSKEEFLHHVYDFHKDHEL